MSRTQSQGLEYFPFAVDFFSDTKVKILKARYGTDGIAIYMYLLCSVYREGYYTRVNEDFIFVISDDLNISSETVQQVMTFLLKRSMFNEQLFKSDAIITSDGIQERWQKAVETRAKKTPIKVSEYWLLSKENTKPYIKVVHFSDSSEKKDHNSEKKGFNSENYRQSKVKESKVKENNTHSAYEEQKEFETRFRSFCGKWKVAIDSYSPLIAELDFEKLDKAYSESEKFLQVAPVARTLSWVVKNCVSICAGKYKDKKETVHYETRRTRTTKEELDAAFEEE